MEEYIERYNKLNDLTKNYISILIFEYEALLKALEPELLTENAKKELRKIIQDQETSIGEMHEKIKDIL